MQSSRPNTAFTEAQFESAYPDGMGNHWWFLARSKIILSVLKKLDLTASSLLEIGCGRGPVVESLRCQQINCRGVELADVSPLTSVRDFVKTGIDATELRDHEREGVDTILLLDVIEHITEPEIFLKQIGRSFPNVTKMIVTVPARQEIWSNYDEYYGHHRRYSIAIMKGLAADLSWNLRYASYFFHLIYLPARILSLLNRDRNTVLSPPGRGFVSLHRLLARVMLLDFYCLPSLFVGTSIICVFDITRR